MSTTVNHVGSEREWKGNLEQWGKHSECIIHWCDGGEVEVFCDITEGWGPILVGRFGARFKYRKKQRFPKAGEVWGTNMTVWIRVVCDKCLDGWVEVGGDAVSRNSNPENLKFLANSLEEYYSK